MIQFAPILLALLFGAAAVILLWYGVSEQLAQGARVNRRLNPASERLSSVGTLAKPDSLVADDPFLQAFEKHLIPQDEERKSRIREKLFRAGYRSDSAVRIYFAVKWGIALAGLMVASLLFAAVMNPANPAIAIAMIVATALIFLFAVDIWVERKIAYRRIDIERSFPDALDLMLVCIEAGHGLDQAIGRMANEIKRSAPILSEEFQLVVAQLRAGKERARVLADFTKRCGVEDISAFVTVIKQADKFGVSIADTLRVYANEMRNKRYMRAEEKANMMPVQLALGAIMFTVPPTILVLIGPSILMIVREMAKAASIGG
ncbi:MAG TPA: type II secretion system F family protein [Parvularculaceae bacterium]|nr:type II secretion system F family protein [Parvularculaceae bacterium]